MKPLVLASLLAACAAPALAQDRPTAPTPPASSATTPATTTAAAAQSSARAAVQAACAADFKASCPDKAGPDLQACVRDNFDKMSEPCRGAIMTMMSQGGGGGR